MVELNLHVSYLNFIEVGTRYISIWGVTMVNFDVSFVNRHALRRNMSSIRNLLSEFRVVGPH